VNSITASDLKTRLDAGEAIRVIDVRERWEVARFSLKFAENIPMNSVPARLDEIPREGMVVIVCHHGHRSAAVVDWLEGQGYTNLYDMTGGTDAWQRMSATLGAAGSLS
jgi:rhodanese-related sulfurtransferase